MIGYYSIAFTNKYIADQKSGACFLLRSSGSDGCIVFSFLVWSDFLMVVCNAIDLVLVFIFLVVFSLWLVFEGMVCLKLGFGESFLFVCVG